MIHNNIELFNSLKPSEYGFLKQMNVKRNSRVNGILTYEIEILLSNVDSTNSSIDLHLLFMGASDLKIKYGDELLGFYISIEDISERQFENKLYHVLEPENDSFSFYCQSFFAELIFNDKTTQ